MSTAQIVAIVSSIVTIIAFVFSVWQHVRLKAAEQALQSVRSISQAAMAQLLEFKQSTDSALERSRYLTLAAYFVSVINTCLVFLRVTRRDVSDPRHRQQAFIYTGDQDAFVPEPKRERVEPAAPPDSPLRGGG